MGVFICYFLGEIAITMGQVYLRFSPFMGETHKNIQIKSKNTRAQKAREA